jgi:hypothetical protein
MLPALALGLSRRPAMLCARAAPHGEPLLTAGIVRRPMPLLGPMEAAAAGWGATSSSYSKEDGHGGRRRQLLYPRQPRPA